MFINVGLGWILDLCPGRTALRGLGWLELGERKLLPAFWPSVREQTSDGQERRAGREGPGCSFSHKLRGGGAWKGSFAHQAAKIGTGSTEGTSFSCALMLTLQPWRKKPPSSCFIRAPLA